MSGDVPPGAGPADESPAATDPSEHAASTTTTTATTKAATAKKTVRRYQAMASVLLAIAALALWSASRLRWARVLAGDGLSPDRDFDVKGADWSPWLAPVALVLLAAIAAAFALRGWGMRLLAILVALVGVLAAFPAVSMVVGGDDSMYAAHAANIADRYVVRLVTTSDWVAAIVLVGTVCCVAAAVLLLRTASGAGMSSKYRTPAARRAELEEKVFAERDRRLATEAAAARTGDQPRAPGHPASPDSEAADSETTWSAVTGDGAATDRTADRGRAEAADGPSAAAAGSDGPPDGPNERMMWDALDTGIDPTDPDPTDPDSTGPR